MSVDPGQILGRYITDEHVRHTWMISLAIAHTPSNGSPQDTQQD